jgi:hypothetical protein
MGLALQLQSKHLLEWPAQKAASRLSAILMTVCQSEQMRQACQNISKELAAEDGTKVAAGYIKKCMERCTSHSRVQVDVLHDLVFFND